MDRNQSKKLLPIIQAYAEGKTIQSRCIKGDTSLWYDDEDPSFDDDFEYRIKPEQKYRPYRNLKECFHDMKNHDPFGYIRKKQKGDLELITGTLDDEHEYLKLSVSVMSTLKTVFERYTYFDDSPFGIKKGNDYE